MARIANRTCRKSVIFFFTKPHLLLQVQLGRVRKRQRGRRVQVNRQQRAEAAAAAAAKEERRDATSGVEQDIASSQRLSECEGRTVTGQGARDGQARPCFKCN